MDRFIDEDEVVSIDVTQDEERLETLKQALDKMSVSTTYQYQFNEQLNYLFSTWVIDAVEFFLSRVWHYPSTFSEVHRKEN